jgi:hypothetical protein
MLNRAGILNLQIGDVSRSHASWLSGPRISSLVDYGHRGSDSHPAHARLYPARPKNADIKITTEEQATMEARIMAALAEKARTKSDIHQMFGALRLSGIELQRIIDEMMGRGLIGRLRAAPRWRCWQYQHLQKEMH